MPDRRPTLSPLALVILALLDESPMYPYRMQQLIRDRGKDQIVNVRHRASLYQTIARLERDALIEIQEHRPGREPSRTYRLPTDRHRPEDHPHLAAPDARHAGIRIPRVSRRTLVHLPAHAQGSPRRAGASEPTPWRLGGGIWRRRCATMQAPFPASSCSSWSIWLRWSRPSWPGYTAPSPTSTGGRLTWTRASIRNATKETE